MVLVNMNAEKEYVSMLNRALSKLPNMAFKRTGRFEIPDVKHMVVGNRTFIKNFKQISETIRRDENHLLRFLAKEMATAAAIEGEQAVFHGKFNVETIKRLIESYVKEYVICPVCRSPDTRIIKEERFRFIVCEACGAKSSIRSI